MVKLRRHWRSAIMLAIALTLPLFYWNCSGKFAAYTNESSQTGDPNLLSNDGLGNFSVSLGSQGSMIAKQDRNFSFTPLTSDPGPFTTDGALPSWASFNAATGKVTGVANSTTGSFNLTVRGSRPATVFGPFAVFVRGNPLKEYQWHLKNTGQTGFALTPGVAGEDIHMSNAVLAGVTGAGVRMAFSDTGIVITHEALAPNVLGGESRNYLNNFASTGTWLGDPTPNLSDSGNAHGTAVSSLAAERGWNDLGGRGVAPDAKIAGFLFIQAQDQLSTAGLLSSATNDQFTGNFDVFNYSWTDPQCALTEYTSNLFDRLAASTSQQRSGKGSIHLMAAGNNYVENIQSCYPNMAVAAVYDNVNFSEMNTNFYVLNIAAVNANGVSSSYSTPGSAIWVSAPGGEFGWDQVGNDAESAMPALVAADYPGCSVGIKTEDSAHSAFDRGQGLNASCKYISTMNGTSGATPIAAGAVALMLQANPNLTWRDVKYILARTADKINPTAWAQHHPHTTATADNLDLTGYVYDQPWITNTAGFNFQNYYGFGRVNVDNAVAMARGFVSPLGVFKQTNWVNDSGVISAAIPDASATGVLRSMAITTNYTLEAVQLRVTTSGCAGDIGLELTAPSGTRSNLMNYNSRLQDGAILDHTFLSNAFYGEHSAGTWTLKVVDGHVGCTANLTNWKLNFAGY